MPLWFEFGPTERSALLLATFAGLSTSIGGAIAILRRPGDSLMAFLLGLAFGVMMLLSVAELWLHATFEHGPLGVSLSVAGGAILYVFAQPLLPTFEHGNQHNALLGSQPTGSTVEVKDAQEPSKGGGSSELVHRGSATGQQHIVGKEAQIDSAILPKGLKGNMSTEHSAASDKYDKLSLKTAELLRLSFLMLITMTAHNLPEGFAVAFSAFSDFGLIMAAAIAVHNIPEGIIVAAPIYAATGSKARAMAVATASGLSEPVGALIALVVVKPFVAIHDLHLLLAFVGGIMGAVCMLELLPEGRKCRQDMQFAQGAILGALVMGWTLYVGV